MNNSHPSSEYSSPAPLPGVSRPFIAPPRPAKRSGKTRMIPGAPAPMPVTDQEDVIIHQAAPVINSAEDYVPHEKVGDFFGVRTQPLAVNNMEDMESSDDEDEWAGATLESDIHHVRNLLEKNIAIDSESDTHPSVRSPHLASGLPQSPDTSGKNPSWIPAAPIVHQDLADLVQSTLAFDNDTSSASSGDSFDEEQ